MFQKPGESAPNRIGFPGLAMEIQGEDTFETKGSGGGFSYGHCFQTPFWSAVKSRLGWKPLAFDLASSEPHGDVLVLNRNIIARNFHGLGSAGSEFRPEPDQYGIFLEALSDALSAYLDPGVAFIRYDLPGNPSTRLRDQAVRSLHQYLSALNRDPGVAHELRHQNLEPSKSAIDLTFADRFVLDLNRNEAEILSNMKPKPDTIFTWLKKRRQGVRRNPDLLPDFYELYRQTAERNRFNLCEYRHFSALFLALLSASGSCEILFLLAAHGSTCLPAPLSLIRPDGTYLFGASANEKRNLMAPYAIHWTAIQLARTRGCLQYDLGAVSPEKSPTTRFMVSTVSKPVSAEESSIRADPGIIR